MKHSIRFTVLTICAVLAGCASAPQGSAPARAEAHAFSGTIAVDPVRLAPDVAAELSGKDRQALERDLRLALMNSLPPQALVSEPRADSLRLEVTVTDIDTSRPAVNAITAALLFVPMDRGGIAFEARFFEGDRLVATHTHRKKGAPLDLGGSFRRYGHALHVIEEWGTTLMASR